MENIRDRRSDIQNWGSGENKKTAPQKTCGTAKINFILK